MPALLWVAFIVYGSLLPFEFAPQPVDAAWDQFVQMPWLEIGAGGRADWLANLLLYLPLTFLLMGVWADGRAPARQWVAALLALICAGALAVSVEYLQVFFPPRTVSRNDLVAELIGASIGIVAWFVAGGRVHGLIESFSRDSGPALRATGIAYSIAYIILALFPFDFLLTPSELVQKAAGPQTGWWLAGQACTRTLQCGVQLMVEAVLAFPLGLVFAASRAGPLRAAPLLALGLLFGAALEAAQFLLASGVAQGASVIAKAAGIAAGGTIASHWHAAWLGWQRWHRRRAAVVVLGGLYLGALAIWLGLSIGVWRGEPISWPAALERLRTLHLLPLYNYYYTSETRALASVLVQAALFAPPGILLALAAGPTPMAKGSLLAGVISGTLALGAQVAMLFHPPQRPDPTDVVIGLAIGAAAYSFTMFLTRTLAQHTPGAPAGNLRPASQQTGREIGVNEQSPPLTSRRRLFVSDIFAAGLLVTLVCAVIIYPLNRPLLSLALLAYAYSLVRWPRGWLVVLPAMLPVMDLVGYSGRLFWSEFDFAIVLTLAVACWRERYAPASPLGHRFPGAVACLLGVSILVSLARGLLPFEPIDTNSFANYHSHYNALRVAKGVAWGALFIWLAGREEMPSSERAKLLAIGFGLGVCGVIAVVVWERFVFSGLLNFSHEYRVTGPFWEMNTGGAAIEGFLVSAMPFVLLLVFAAESPIVRAGALATFGAGVYAVLVTMSRNGIIALAISLIVVCIGVLINSLRRHRMVFKGLAGATVLVALAGAISLPILTGATLSTRFGQVDSDLQTRREHWRLALDLRDSNWTTSAFGMGFGRFPEMFYWGGTGTRPASYRFIDEGGVRFLRLGGGRALYFEQFVEVDPDSRYSLSFLVRSNTAGVNFVVPICEKWLLASFECAWITTELRAASAEFERRTIVVNSGALSKGAWYARRPVRLALYNPNGQGTVDVADVHLFDSNGVDLLDNGDFAKGIDHWHFSTDDHLPWHVKNLVVQILFDQGWLGVLAWGLACVLALVRAGSAMWSGDLFGTTVLAALVGFLIVGVFDSLIDGPRLLFMFCLLLWLAYESRPANAFAHADRRASPPKRVGAVSRPMRTSDHNSRQGS